MLCTIFGTICLFAEFLYNGKNDFSVINFDSVTFMRMRSTSRFGHCKIVMRYFIVLFLLLVCCVSEVLACSTIMLYSTRVDVAVCHAIKTKI